MYLLRFLTDHELTNLYKTLYREIITDCYGWDWPTLYAQQPDLAESLKAIQAEAKRRKADKAEEYANAPGQ